MQLVTSINGKIVKRGQDKISVFDNSLLYADGLFETCLAIDNEIIFLKEHIDRLFRGAKVTGSKIPIDKETLKSWIQSISKKHPSKIQKIRLTVTAGEAARWLGEQGQPQVIISAAPHVMPTKPFKLHLSDFRVDQDSVFRRIKTLSYAIHAAALRQAFLKKCDDSLLLNEIDNIAEVTSANIFWVKKNKIYTPPLTSGCLEGITRKIVMHEARKLGHEIIERDTNLVKLSNADEIFISSSLKLIVGVSLIKANRINLKFSDGPFTKLFQKHFYSLINLS